jgi:hypothetical protein
LLQAGDAEAARTLARRARDAAEDYYAPEAAALLETDALVRAIPAHAPHH